MSALLPCASAVGQHLAFVWMKSWFSSFADHDLDHFGVVKALLDANMLPRVIAGTSCGSLVAALVCTRTDDELRKLLVPELAPVITGTLLLSRMSGNKIMTTSPAACAEGFFTWFPRLLKTGARFDTLKWADEVDVFFTEGCESSCES